MLASAQNNTCPTLSELAGELSKALLPGKSHTSIIHGAVGIIRSLFCADLCSFFIYEDGLLKLSALSGVPEADTPAHSIEMGEGPVGRAALRGAPVAGSGDECAAALPSSGDSPEIKTCFCVPMIDNSNLYGVMALHCSAERVFTEIEGMFALFAAAQVVVAVRNAYFQEEIFRNIGDMAILHRIGQIVNSLMEEKDLLDLVAQTCAEHLNSRGCALRLLNGETNSLEVRSVFGIRLEDIPNKTVRVGDGIAGKVAATLNPVLTNNLAETEDLFGDKGIAMNSVVCVPIVYKGRLLGTLAIFDRLEIVSGEIQPFDESDVGLVTAVASQVALALENSRLFEESRNLSEEKEIRIKGLSLLMEITNIMRSTLDLEEILYIILTSVTMGEGLGFNRACLFLADSSGKHLAGKMAVGPRSADEARQNWTAVDPHGKSLYEIIREYGLYNMQAGFEIDRRIRETVIPIARGKGIVADTAIDRMPYSVCEYSSPEGSEESVLGELHFTRFATIPLILKETLIGVILVDNLVTNEPITAEALNFLLIFANQAASAIEIARIYKSLEETNKRLIDAQDLLVRAKTLATLGEFSAGVAHELRNPLVSIGGFARRLAKMLDGEVKEARYARIIATEVENLERILSQILEFVGGGQPVRKKVDIVLLLEQVFTLFRDQMEKLKISLVTEFDETVRHLWVDEVQMRQLFINLIKNALEAMEAKGGTLKVASTRMADTGGAGFEISDTGVGISGEDLEKVFDPFFTKKTTGTGLGLSMCSRIVEGNHGGRIFMDSKKNHGTSVLVWLPDSAILTQDEISADNAAMRDETNA